jgi:CSLREA domain-containing protein
VYVARLLVKRNTRVRKNRTAAIMATLVAALIALAAVPAFASAAAEIEVDSLADSPQTTPGAICDTGAPEGENCTLRAAIEAANFSSDPSVIEFPLPPFEGGQEIEPGTALPAIAQPLTMLGHPVPYGAYSGPAVGVRAPAGAAGLTVESNGVTIENMAFSGGKAGIEVVNQSSDFVSKGNWFGLRVIGTPASISGPGVVLGPGSDGAKIGEGSGSSRNVFTNATYGIYIEGASHTEVLGNYIGVGPTGKTTGAIGNGVRIVDTATSPAEENLIGGSRTSALGTADCGGDCNVIVASGLGIDLHGDASKSLGSPTGPTTISGNYIGLAADGTAISVPTAFSGIYAERPTGTTASPGPGHVTVGGSTAAEANVIDNGAFGMLAEGAEGLLVERNLFGWLPAPAGEGSGPESAALVLIGEGLADRPEALENEMYLGPNAVGIESFGPGAQIVGNRIFGSETGVLTAEDDTGIGNVIAGNLIEGPNLNGALIENNDNTVTGNTIVGAGRSGVLLDREEVTNPWPTANRIGGDSLALENLIEGSGESAISLGGEPETTNEVLGNFGLGNGGPFILLREHRAEHPTNEEIKPPTLETVYEAGASGTAKPGAKVRLFGKPSTDPGSLERMIGSAIADVSGHWTATFTTKQAVGRLVAATQTTAAGTPNGATSEVSAPTATVSKSPAEEQEEKQAAEKATREGQEKAAQEQREREAKEKNDGGSSGAGSSGSGSAKPVPTPAPVPSGPVAKVAPKVKITAGPKKSSTATIAQFKFKATNVSSAKFECKLDGAKWASCKSPKTYKKLGPGKHTFRVRAKANGLTGGVLKSQFTIKA